MNSEAASTVAEEEDFGEQGQAKLIKSLEVHLSRPDLFIVFVFVSDADICLKLFLIYKRFALFLISRQKCYFLF